MTPQDFVGALATECRDSAVADCLAIFAHPPGRKPAPELVRISEWYKSLDSEGQMNVAAAIREAADATLFGVLCVIDGVRTIEPIGDKSEFTILARRLGVESLIAPGPEFLHDLLRAEP